MRLSQSAEALIRRAEKRGLYFDVLESRCSALRFIQQPPYGSLYFSTWKELQAYLNNICE